MCKIAKYQFACWHQFKLPISRCRGTFHKERRFVEVRSACNPEPYITIALPIDCGACQQARSEDQYLAKIKRGNDFREDLVKTRQPGVKEVSRLIEQLQNTHDATTCWGSHRFYPSNSRKAIERVPAGARVVQKSPLSQEVYPEDIVIKEPLKEDHDDGDEDYVRSTDPLHPIDTNYAHPLDDGDMSWLAEHLSPEELASSGSSDGGFVLGSSGWGWDAESDGRAAHSTDDCTNDGDGQDASFLTAWGPDWQGTPTSAVFGMDGLLPPTDDDHSAAIAETVKHFWEIINAEPGQAPLPTPSPLDLASQQLNITATAPSPNSFHCASQIWIDGPSEWTLTLPIRTRTRRLSTWDENRAQIQEYKDSDRQRYCTNWLRVARGEIKEQASRIGRVVKEPPMMKLGPQQGVGVSEARKGKRKALVFGKANYAPFAEFFASVGQSTDVVEKEAVEQSKTAEKGTTAGKSKTAEKDSMVRKSLDDEAAPINLRKGN
ncbi:hypothetical protein BDV95DRAFT_538971 [Massariosphaeria phaeospora]|uniref:Uncharacterized protein n=1 Tax=Massariosphaeria phaeospora TaxID=100035 RepID=A0A7C8IB94_9PLEO|nr:hypothetical protein BDV95DRAFT_538971 [Massariosphaeria phaeospora]